MEIDETKFKRREAATTRVDCAATGGQVGGLGLPQPPLRSLLSPDLLMRPRWCSDRKVRWEGERSQFGEREVFPPPMLEAVQKKRNGERNLFSGIEDNGLRF